MMVVALGMVMELDDAPCASSPAEDDEGIETAERDSLSSVSHPAPAHYPGQTDSHPCDSS